MLLRSRPATWVQVRGLAAAMYDEDVTRWLKHWSLPQPVQVCPAYSAQGYKENERFVAFAEVDEADAVVKALHEKPFQQSILSAQVDNGAYYLYMDRIGHYFEGRRRKSVFIHNGPGWITYSYMRSHLLRFCSYYGVGQPQLTLFNPSPSQPRFEVIRPTQSWIASYDNSKQAEHLVRTMAVHPMLFEGKEIDLAAFLID